MNSRFSVTLLAAVGVLAVNSAALTAQTASMTVSATVRPSCRVTVSPAGLDDAGGARVALACGHAALRTLRVTTDAGEPLVNAPALTHAAKGWREVRFVIPQVVATLATVSPRSLPAEPTHRDVVTVTLEF